MTSQIVVTRINKVCTLNCPLQKEDDGVLKAHILSRHTSNKSYNLWVEYTQGLNPITGWYCGRRSGACTLGCCAHVASVLWYLGYYRNETENSKTKPSKMNNIQRKNTNGP